MKRWISQARPGASTRAPLKVGARGTIFEVQVTFGTAQAATPAGKVTRVAVTRGEVAVRPRAPKGRHALAGPRQVGNAERERRFVPLQKNRMVEIGDDGWKEATYHPRADAGLRRFLNATP